MTKSELIEKLVETNEEFTKSQVELIFNTVFESIKEALIRGERVEVRGFGNFTVRTRNPRKARNPKTGVDVELPERRAVHFKAGKELLALLNPSE